MSGFLLLDKPGTLTSFGAVARVRRIAGEKRVGHTGTLDPMATGVLPILLGRATALSSYLLDADKAYNARIKLGIKTDTYDITGNITDTVSDEIIRKITDNDIDAVLNIFKGTQMQIPPMYSALKKDGVRLYQLARQGKTVDIPEREIIVYSIIKTCPLDDNFEFTVETRVSKGTYIRSLCRDIGEKLGCGAVLTSLRRTEVSGFSVSECVPLDELSVENFSEYMMSPERAVCYMPQISVTEKQAVRFTNGGELDFERLNTNDLIPDTLFRVKCGEDFLGIGFADAQKQQMAVKCVINSFIQGR